MPRKSTTASRMVDLMETFKVDPQALINQLIVEVAHRRTSVPRKAKSTGPKTVVSSNTILQSEEF